jgi:hypothetical protein
MLQCRDATVARMRALDGLRELHLIADKDDVAGSHAHCDNVR